MLDVIDHSSILSFPQPAEEVIAPQTLSLILISKVSFQSMASGSLTNQKQPQRMPKSKAVLLRSERADWQLISLCKWAISLVYFSAQNLCGVLKMNHLRSSNMVPSRLRSCLKEGLNCSGWMGAPSRNCLFLARFRMMFSIDYIMVQINHSDNHCFGTLREGWPCLAFMLISSLLSSASQAYCEIIICYSFTVYAQLLCLSFLSADVAWPEGFRSGSPVFEALLLVPSLSPNKYRLSLHSPIRFWVTAPLQFATLIKKKRKCSISLSFLSPLKSQADISLPAPNSQHPLAVLSARYCCWR